MARFDENLASIWPLLRVNLALDKIVNLLWRILNVLTQIVVFENCQILNNYSGHTVKEAYFGPNPAAS